MSLSLETCLAERYQIISHLGAGGMGEVYRARDLRLGRDVAIKVLPEHLASSPEALSRFQREARAIAALSHTNILAIHDFVIDQNVSFAVMELLQGETLRKHIENSALPWRKAGEIGIAIAEGLAAAHSKGVTHRDLKPENVFLTSDGQLKILDFGLAQLKPTPLKQELSAAPTQSQITQIGSVMGTVPYMSPEQVRGISMDARSDIFSFGSVLYEMLTGNRAFAGTTAADTMAAILKEEPTALAELRSKVPEELARVVAHCLEKNPEQRFQSARDLAFDLKTALSGEAVIGRFPAISKRLVPSAILITAVLLIGLLCASLYMFATRPKAIHSLAILPFTNTSQDATAEYLSDGITESVINSLSQLPELRVMARSTVFRYKNRVEEPLKIGRDLKVQVVLIGSLIQQGDIVKITTELVNVSDGSQIWGEQYKRRMAELPEIQSEISTEIAEKLRLKLTAEQKKRLAKRYTENTEAYKLYLSGLYYFFKSTEEDYKKSFEYFQRAIEKDPGYPLAYSGICGYYNGMTFDGYLSPKEAWPKSKAACEKALQLDKNLATAHNGIAGLYFYYEWNWSIAEKEYKQSIELDPGNPQPRRGYSWYLAAMGRTEEAIKQLRIALEVDPLSLHRNVQLGQFLTIAGRYDEAIKQIQKTLEIDPDYDPALFSLADVYVAKGMFDDAIAVSKRAEVLLGNDHAAEIFAKAHGESGYRNAMKILAQENLDQLLELSKRQYASPLEIASIYAGLGKKDEAFEWLEKAYEERSSGLPFLKIHRNWDNLRSDPRFADLVRRVGLP